VKTPVSASIFEPDKSLFKNCKNDKAEVTVYFCSNSEECPLFKNKQCTWHGIIGWQACPYGEVKSEKGPTKRAKNYHKWIADKKAAYGAIQGQIVAGAPDQLTYIGEYVYVPYAHAALNNTTVKFIRADNLFLSGIRFILKEDWNVETVKNLVTHRPQALMGGEITSYAKEEVPKFLAHLRFLDKPLFSEFSKKYPDLIKSYAAQLPEIIGRTALLQTLKPNINIELDGELYHWDGVTLTTASRKKLFFLPIKDQNNNTAIESTTLSVKPSHKAVVKVMDPDWVTSETKFIN